jgi:hypothetical protein
LGGAVNVVQKAATTVEDILHESEDAYQVEETFLHANDDPEFSDNESVSTEAEDNEGGLPQLTTLEKLEVLVSIQGSSKIAIDKQTIAQVFYDLE